MRKSCVSALILALVGSGASACGGGADESPSAPAGGRGGSAGSGGGDSGTPDGKAGTGGSDAGFECRPDSDGDNIPDGVEGQTDTDGDGLVDAQDPDSDADSVPDGIEADTAHVGCNLPLDSDADGKPNQLDTDSDANGIADRDEVYSDGAAYDASRPIGDADQDGVPDLYERDNDGDTIDDSDELVAGASTDTDRDGLPDHDDFDSDADGIGDGFETLQDGPDKDGTPNFRDLDSDNDAVPDACEAGPNHALADPPADTDRDGQYDFIDLDADNDGLKDGVEDANGNCAVDAGESSRGRADTDGDGASDLIEIHLGSSATDAAITPQSLGRYYFVMPYNSTPLPPVQDVVLKTNLNRGDIAFIVDSTGTMGGAIADVKANLLSLMTAVKVDVPEARFGVLTHEDYPVVGYGSAGNLPVHLPDLGPTEPFGISRAYLTTNTQDTSAAVSAITTRDGADLAESQVVAAWKALTNGVLYWPTNGTQTAFSPPSGGFGALGFDDKALPILVMVTDAPFHNGKRVGTTALHDTYSFNGTGLGAPPTVDDLVTEMKKTGAKLVGVALDGGGPARPQKDPYRDLAYIVDQTKSYVFPSAFKSTQCLTDIAGGSLSPDGPGSPPTCRLIFSVYPQGTGTARTIEDGIKALLRGIRLEVRIRAESVPLTPRVVCDVAGAPKIVDATDDFIDFIDVFPTGNVEDPAERGQFCETLDINDLRDWFSGPRGVIGGRYDSTASPPCCDVPDSHNETATNVTPGIRVCFKITPKRNTICPQKPDAQVVKASMTIWARNEGQLQELVLGQPRDVFFVVPPQAQ